MERDASSDVNIEQVKKMLWHAATKVMHEIGPGGPESLYRAALCSELKTVGYSDASEEAAIYVPYNGRIIGTLYADIVFGRVVVELKATKPVSEYATGRTPFKQVMLYKRHGGYQHAFVLFFSPESDVAVIYVNDDDCKSDEPVVARMHVD